jgi:chemotaxis signal transduction protein
MNPRLNESVNGNDVGQLRQAFDRAFALPPTLAAQALEDLLSISVAGNPYVLRLLDIAEIVMGRKIISVPAVTPDLLGLVGMHGGIVPVFDLSSILGHGPNPGAPDWMILCGTKEPIAFAFSHFEGYLQLPRSALHADENFRAQNEEVKYVSQIANAPDGTRAVISMPLVMASIHNRISQPRPTKESSK